jgi:hypothetical protein
MNRKFYVARARFFGHVALTFKLTGDAVSAAVYRRKARVTMLRARAAS